ncbi:MAG: TraB/GumN family protein [Oscillospiraceae bacterium]|nr:TraB/GumN family protein [Oscillospiraceae bacterium]
MRKTKKLLSLLIAIIITLSIITACDSNEESTTPEQSTPAQSTPAVRTSDDVKPDETDSAPDETEPRKQDSNPDESEPYVPELTPTGDAKGLLWEVSDEDTTIYLLGTIHLLNDVVFPFDQQLTNVILSSDLVVFEADFGDEEGLMYLQMAMMYDEGDRLSDHISGDLFAQVVEIYELLYGAGIGIAEIIEGFKPWALSSEIMLHTLSFSEELALMQGGAIDASVYLTAIEAGISVTELEGWVFQADLFNSFDDDIMEEYLQTNVDFFFAALEGSPEADEEFKIMSDWMRAWAERDVEGFETAFEKDLLEDDPFSYALLDLRDPLMYEYVLALMNEFEGQVLIVVGAAHMVGEGGIVARFIADGYEVNVVDFDYSTSLNT